MEQVRPVLECARACENLRKKRGKGKFYPANPARLPLKPQDGKIAAMKFLQISAAVLSLAFLRSPAVAQALAPTPVRTAPAVDLQLLLRKLDEQNAKIDILSQQILKLEQQITNIRPGVMIGETTPPPAAVAPPKAEAPPAAGGNSHTVARGETLTSIAKMHGVTISELQKVNQIEDERKLRAGQTIVIPGGASPAPSVTTSPN